MKIFGFNIGGNKPTQQTTSAIGSMAFSTPFMKVGGANLSLPYVSTYYTTNNIILFGEDNLYPQLLNQLYYTSPIHSQCIEFITNAVIGGGYSWTDETVSAAAKVDQLTFEKSNKFSKLSRLLTRDYIIHRRVCVIVKKINDKIVKFARLDPSTIRNNADLSKFAYSYDWSRGYLNAKEYHKYYPDTKETECLYVFQDNTPGQSIYPIPSYNSALNWCALDGDLSYFHKNNMQNSIFPSIVIKRPKDFSSVEEVDKFKAEISSKTGASNAGRVLVLTGNGKDDLPEFQQVSANNNDGAFEVSAKECKESISIAHGINPSIMGVKTAGSLGNKEEIETSYIIFEKNVVQPTRLVMEEILNDLVDISKIPNTIVINNFQIIDKVIVDATETK
jgi:hypothetical protein